MTNLAKLILVLLVALGSLGIYWANREPPPLDMNYAGQMRENQIENAEVNCVLQGRSEWACHEQYRGLWEQWAFEFPELARARQAAHSF